jgi:hypothetical protein
MYVTMPTAALYTCIAKVEHLFEWIKVMQQYIVITPNS